MADKATDKTTLQFYTPENIHGTQILLLYANVTVHDTNKQTKKKGVHVYIVKYQIQAGQMQVSW